MHHVALVILIFGASVEALGSDEPFDFHSVRGRDPVASKNGRYEGELHLATGPGSRTQSMDHYGTDWSGDAHLLWEGEPGDSFRTSFDTRKPGRYQIRIRLTKAPDYGRFEIRLNETKISGSKSRGVFDLYSDRVELDVIRDLGEHTLPAGRQSLEFRLTGSNPRAVRFRKTMYLLGIDYIELTAASSSISRPDLNSQPNLKPDGEAERPSNRVSVSPISTVTASDLVPAIRTLRAHCHSCHDGEDASGNTDLAALKTPGDFRQQLTVTQKILDVVSRREMPPAEESPLKASDLEALTSVLSRLVRKELTDHPRHSPTVMRRLNRYEYSNSVRDLLDLRGDIYPLPEKVVRSSSPYFQPSSGRFPDAVSVGNRTLGKNQVEKQILTGVSPFAIDLQAEHGFNNRGEQLSISPIFIESVLQLAQSIVNAPEFPAYCSSYKSLFLFDRGLSGKLLEEAGRTRIQPILNHAFRRDVDQQTLDRYVEFFLTEAERTGDPQFAMSRTIAAAISSPRFLYIVESNASTDAAKQLDAFELATRLALFIWSSLPDAELLAAARSGRLLTDSGLTQQINRMLENPRSRALAENFARQWLRLDQLITAVPDFERFPEYYSRIGCEQWKFGLQTMIEPLLLFESIIVEDRSIMLLIDSNYSYRSDELQSWYSDKLPFQNRENRNRFNTNMQGFRRRSLADRREGGVITSAATLTMTSSPLRTSPITRGAWVATVIFNQPPPPPPDAIPEIEADDRAIESLGVTLRQRLKQHQSNQSCASCHSKIDPLGFALENYDAVGRWRDSYQSGLPIDASGQLFGQSTFDDAVGLKDSILSNPEWFMRAFSEHMLSYALGRELDLNDRVTVDGILKQVVRDHGQFSTVVKAIVLSNPFRSKVRQAATP